jgi:hypothetical protein
VAGGLVAKLHDANLPNKELKAIGAALAADKSVLVLVVEQGQGVAAKNVLTEVGAAAIVEGLDENVVARLEEHPAPIATAPADEPSAD